MDKDNRIYFIPNNPDNSTIIEYLNDVRLTDIETEIHKLEKFGSLTNVEEKENYIMTTLYGFDEFHVWCFC